VLARAAVAVVVPALTAFNTDHVATVSASLPTALEYGGISMADDMSEAVDAIFDVSKFGEIRIEVRLPGPCTDNGEPIIFTLSQLLTPEEIGIKPVLVPEIVRRVARILMGAMTFR
jgi:hypothetical protein